MEYLKTITVLMIKLDKSLAMLCRWLEMQVIHSPAAGRIKILPSAFPFQHDLLEREQEIFRLNLNPEQAG